MGKYRTRIGVGAEIRKKARKKAELDLARDIATNRAHIQSYGPNDARGITRHIRSNPALYNIAAMKYWERPPVKFTEVAAAIESDPALMLALNKTFKAALMSPGPSKLATLYRTADTVNLHATMKNALKSRGHNVSDSDVTKIFNILALVSPNAFLKKNKSEKQKKTARK